MKSAKQRHDELLDRFGGKPFIKVASKNKLEGITPIQQIDRVRQTYGDKPNPMTTAEIAWVIASGLSSGEGGFEQVRQSIEIVADMPEVFAQVEQELATLAE